MPELAAVAAALEGVGLVVLLVVVWNRADNERKYLQKRLLDLGAAALEDAAALRSAADQQQQQQQPQASYSDPLAGMMTTD